MGDPMTKINGHEVEYYVNSKKKTVTAKIGNTSADALHKFEEISGLEPSWDHNWSKTKRPFSMQIEMSCTAKCHPDDEFDTNIGKIIAYKKLQKKYWLKYSKAIDRIYFYLTHNVVMALDAEWDITSDRSANIDPFSILNKK